MYNSNICNSNTNAVCAPRSLASPLLLGAELIWQSIVVTDCVLKHGCAGKEVRMADVQLYYLSKAILKLSSLTSPEQSETEIAHTLECLKAEYLQVKQRAGKEARLDCDLSP